MELQLKPTTSTTGFVFPAIYSFPPFYTQQPNSTTWEHQSKQWIALILAYAKHHRIFSLAITNETLNLDLFRNASISRQLPLSTLKSIIDQMTLTNTAEYDPKPTRSSPTPTSALIYWRTPQEWANIIYDWINTSGLVGSIMTFYELTTGGDLAESTEFYKLPESILRKALDVLAKSGKAQVFKATNDDGEQGDGVKFL